jgi:N-acetyl-anhydromuramyl-L-alanine amidase AmpD
MHLRALAILALTGLALPAAADKSAGPRPGKADLIVIHATSGPICSDDNTVVFTPAPLSPTDAQDLLTFIEKEGTNSIHYVIGRRGDVVVGAPETDWAQHAGQKAVNQRSIGIELVNRGDGVEPFPPEQMEALTKLVREIRTRNTIPLAGIIRHSDVDLRNCACGGVPYRRRVDPNTAFDLDAFRKSVALPEEKLGKAKFPTATKAPTPEQCGGRS